MQLLTARFISAILAMVPLLSIAADQVRLESLLLESVARDPDVEIIVSRVHIPANHVLPRHWHPGEEFVYVLEGPVSLELAGEGDIPLSQGEAHKIPPRQVHTAITGDEPATVVVFRVHPRGEPVRVLAE